jgi:hypothetical protein
MWSGRLTVQSAVDTVVVERRPECLLTGVKLWRTHKVPMYHREEVILIPFVTKNAHRGNEQSRDAGDMKVV